MKNRLLILLSLALLLFISACADNTPDNAAVKELFETAAEKLIEYSTEEPAYVLNKDFDGMLEIDYSGDYKTINEIPFQKTDLDYQRAVEKYSLLFTEDALTNFLSKYFYDDSGTLCVTAVGGATGYAIENVVITYEGENNGEYSYKAVFDISDDPKESRFSVKKEGTDYRISEIDFFQ